MNTRRILLGRALAIAGAATFQSSCARPSLQISSAALQWKRFETRIGGNVISYELPVGDDYSPYPQTSIAIDPANRSAFLGGSVFGQRPQGRELASLLIRVDIERILGDINVGAMTSESFLNALQDQERTIAKIPGPGVHRVEGFQIVKFGTEGWVYRRRVNQKDGLLWGDEYCRALEGAIYIVVRSVLWTSAAKVQETVVESGKAVRKIAEGLTVRRAD